MTECEYKMCDEDASEELLEQLKRIDGGLEEKKEQGTWKKLREKVKPAQAHIGLMVSLCVYCAVGGLVSWMKLKQMTANRMINETDVKSKSKA